MAQAEPGNDVQSASEPNSQRDYRGIALLSLLPLPIFSVLVLVAYAYTYETWLKNEGTSHSYSTFIGLFCMLPLFLVAGLLVVVAVLGIAITLSKLCSRQHWPIVALSALDALILLGLLVLVSRPI